MQSKSINLMKDYEHRQWFFFFFFLNWTHDKVNRADTDVITVKDYVDRGLVDFEKSYLCACSYQTRESSSCHQGKNNHESIFMPGCTFVGVCVC